MQNSSRHQQKKRNKKPGPELPLALWIHIAESINGDSSWYITMRLQQMMWGKRGNKLQYKNEDREYENWEITSWGWKMHLRRVKQWIQDNRRGSPWQYKVGGTWKSIGVWFLQAGDYRKVDRHFWWAWRILICSCRKEKFDIREFMRGRHRWDLCKSCAQGEVVKHTRTKSLERLVLLQMVEQHVFQVLPLWRARRSSTTDFPWCRDTTGYTHAWSVQECWLMEYLLEDE
ncbi:protein Q [Caprine arthritis encephalitis virus]|uniref:Virion infectivity factor n=1 Tax=Caprine arthritis encephalitis virus (strain Cork) TaxID=11661 RepID=VIF_CAEVC|nr:protein Q [Caprine arthritis encephalitis virus]P33462.1 RecName: Full=Virion infectivity factor; AltName: Full=Q protein; AltName: Full=SOR protein [Caprine arthritis encephalitis virus strain Cork]AAA91827.1 protein Q [Caprine arthritis encephalitis virus]